MTVYRLQGDLTGQFRRLATLEETVFLLRTSTWQVTAGLAHHPITEAFVFCPSSVRQYRSLFYIGPFFVRLLWPT